jgi:hypothetical protein
MRSDEAHFHMNGFVSKQNWRFWSAVNTREVHQRPLHSSKLTVWCVVSKLGIVGPYFFEEGETPVTVTSARYIDMLKTTSCILHVSWPPRPPLIYRLVTFFLRGHLKARVYTNRPRTIQVLKLSIRQEIAAVPEDMLENAMQNFEERLQMCVQQDGLHLTDIIFRT